MHRLFSSFARGLPGLGLFLLRVVAATVLASGGFQKCQSGQGLPLILGLLSIVDGLFLLIGFWTPIAGSIVVPITACGILFLHEEPRQAALLAAIGAALTLLGPGGLSIDARVFGWKKIDFEH